MRNVSTFLDRTRWVAALLVAAGHLRNFLMVDWSAVTRHDSLTGSFYWLTGFGRIAVIVFFVLSGYLVGGRAFVTIESGAFNPKSYALNRLSRLYPPLLVAIVLTVLFDTVGLHFGNAFGYYSHPNTYHVAGEFASVPDTLNGRTALLNLLFLQTILGPTFGSDTPLWSLANEFWYYVIGPLAGLCLFGTIRSRVMLIPALVLLLATVLWLNDSIALLSATWFAGAFAYQYSKPLPQAATRSLFVLFCGVAAAVRSDHWFAAHQLVADLAVGASFAAVLCSAGRPGPAPVTATLASRLAGFSYSLYLVHVPLLFFLAAFSLQRFSTPERLQPGFDSLLIYLVGLASSIGLAYGVSRVTEARTEEVRAWLRPWRNVGAIE